MLTTNVEIDVFDNLFSKHAGSDNVMDQQEFDRFTKDANLTRSQASSLWHVLDADNSGQVSLDEFGVALANMHAARAWLAVCEEVIG